jgi:hypothetical protein
MQNILYKYKIYSSKTLFFIIVFLIFVSTPFYDDMSNEYINNSLKNSAITYATLRGLNSAISIIQNSSINFGIGVEATIAIGEILDPINDAIERFSDMITLSIWALGSEKILYQLSKTPLIIMLISILLILAILTNKEFFIKILLILVILRIFIPFSAIVSSYTYKTIFEPNIKINLHTLQSYPKIENSILSIKKSIQYYTNNSKKFINAILELSMLYFGRFILDILLIPLFLIYILKSIKFD